MDGLAGPAPGAIYCYSIDQENYFGDFGTREDALAAAADELERGDEPGGVRIVWTGVQRSAMDCLRKSAALIGQDVAERMDDWLTDDIAHDDAIIKAPDHAALGNALLDVLERHATFSRWAAIQIQEHAVNVPGGEPEVPDSVRGAAPGPARRSGRRSLCAEQLLLRGNNA